MHAVTRILLEDASAPPNSGCSGPGTGSDPTALSTTIFRGSGVSSTSGVPARSSNPSPARCTRKSRASPNRRRRMRGGAPEGAAATASGVIAGQGSRDCPAHHPPDAGAGLPGAACDVGCDAGGDDGGGGDVDHRDEQDDERGGGEREQARATA